MKELFNLGVLNGPDLDLMNQMMLDPTDPLTVAEGSVGGLFGGDGIRERSLANIDQLRSMFRDMRNAWQTGGAIPQETGGAPDGSAGGIPAGVAAEDWEFLTPEERALFQ